MLLRLESLLMNYTKRGNSFAGFTAQELKVIALRTNGVKTPDIAKQMGITRKLAYQYLWRIYVKVGVDDVALLTRWAMANGLDELLGPETEETKEIVPPKVYKQRIKLGRLRRAAYKLVK